MRHVRKFHKYASHDLCSNRLIAGKTDLHAQNFDDVCINNQDVSEVNRDATMEHDYMQNVHTAGVSLIAGLRAKANISSGVVTEIVTSFNAIPSSMSLHFEFVIANSLKLCGAEDSLINNVKQSVSAKLSQCCSPFSFLETGYKQDQFFW